MCLYEELWSGCLPGVNDWWQNRAPSTTPMSTPTASRQRVPGVAMWVEACYSTQPLFHLGPTQFVAFVECSRGTPIGPLGFAITLQSMVERIKAEVPNLTINSWFLNDGTLMGSPEDLAAALNIVEAEGPALRLYLNRSISLLFIPQDEDCAVSSLPSEIPITRQGFTLLGGPIGPPSFCEASLLHQVEKIKAVDWRIWVILSWRQHCSDPLCLFPSFPSPFEHAPLSCLEWVWPSCTWVFRTYHWWTHLPLVLTKGFTA